MGIALASTLYQKSTNLWFRGELGAGKTTLIKGLGLGLGLGEIITSPTYAIENRYGSTALTTGGSTGSPGTGEKFLHIDLYRLDEKEAQRIVEESENFPGVRAIEWSERVSPSGDGIFISISELSETKRSIEITFDDIPLPSREEIETWRREVRLPQHIARHCDAVARMAETLGAELIARGIPLRPLALKRACELHDLLRFVDFKASVQKKIPHAQEADRETQALWDSLKTTYGDIHETACEEFLKEHGYPELGEIVRPHGLHSIVEEPETIRTIEQKLLFYADKRVRFEMDVSVDERFDEFIERYGDGVESEWAKIARERTKEMEKELFG